MSSSAKIPVILDVETSDPDDLMTLFFLGGHPRVDLKAVLVSPGTPTQLLLVDAALRMIQHRKTSTNSAVRKEGSASVECATPIGYFDLDLVLPHNGDTAESGEVNPFRDAQGRLYEDLFPAWKKEVKYIFYGGQNTRMGSGKGGPETKGNYGKGGGKGGLETKGKPGQNVTNRPSHERLKAHALGKLTQAGRRVDEGWKILMEMGGADVVLVTGGPVWNLGKAVEKSLNVSKPGLKPLKLRKWCAQGGFAGYNALTGMAPDVLRRLKTELPRFMGVTTNPAWNFDLSHTEVIAALNYPGIGERWICSKNVCHRVCYDMEMHKQIAAIIAAPTSELAGSTGPVAIDAPTYKKKRWGGGKSTMDSQNESDGQGLDHWKGDFSEGSMKCESTASLTTGSATSAAHPGLVLFHEMMELYKKANQKKLHDILPALCAIDPSLTGCTFRQARLEWVPERGKHNESTKNTPVSCCGAKRIFPDPAGRWKNGGEWGCVGDVGKWIDFSTSDCRSATTESTDRSRGDLGNHFNVWITVDVNIESFRRGFLAG